MYPPDQRFQRYRRAGRLLAAFTDEPRAHVWEGYLYNRELRFFNDGVGVYPRRARGGPDPVPDPVVATWLSAPFEILEALETRGHTPPGRDRRRWCRQCSGIPGGSPCPCPESAVDLHAVFSVASELPLADWLLAEALADSLRPGVEALWRVADPSRGPPATHSILYAVDRVFGKEGLTDERREAVTAAITRLSAKGVYLEALAESYCVLQVQGL